MDIVQFCVSCISQSITLILVANAAPIITRKLLDDRLALPIDFNHTLNDGSALFGYTKTWRGLLAAVAGTMLAAPLLGLSFLLGAFFGLLVMTGDLFSSFIKRRTGFIESSRTRGLDVIPEALLPLLMLQGELRLHWIDIIIVVVLFFLVETFISPVLFQMHIRNRPY